MAAVALTAALTMGPLPLFHSVTELADWQTGWTSRMVEGETPKLIVEFLDMSSRHPCQLSKCEIQVAHRTTNSAPIANELVGEPGVEQWRPLVALYWPPELV